jgi:hypothetical protein
MSDPTQDIINQVEKQTVDWKELCEKWENLYKRLENNSFGWEPLYRQTKKELEELKNARANDKTIP